MQVTLAFFLIAGLLFAGGVFAVLLYAKISDQDDWVRPTVYELTSRLAEAELALKAKAAVTGVEGSEVAPEPAEAAANGGVAAPAPQAAPAQPAPVTVMLDAPIVRQLPELPSGCEITSLTMLLNYKGIAVTKLEMAAQMKRDTTPLRYNKDGSVGYWGNPNTGFVGDPTGKSRGFGIYHTALFPQLKSHIPTAVDLTRKPFSKLEEQLRNGIPSVVWTTIDYKLPSKWVVWDTPLGPIQTTFMEHAVLLVGYDEQFVYVNDPLSGESKKQIDKQQFKKVWDAMGRQAISYTNG